MISIKQIGSQFYCVITEENGKIRIISDGYPTFELCFMMTKMDEIFS